VTPIAPTPELRRVAERVVWFKAPDEALSDPRHFLAHVMVYGTPEDIATARAAVPPEAFEEVLEHPPPGVFDSRSWAYWNLVILGISPAPPIPPREFGSLSTRNG
jgi:hypothetical protein